MHSSVTREMKKAGGIGECPAEVGTASWAHTLIKMRKSKLVGTGLI